MKFISKNSNYLLVLTSSEPAIPTIGKHAIRGQSVRFEDGVAIVEPEDICKKMLDHPAFGIDFVLADGEKDPYEDTRKHMEPEHNILELEHGSVAKNVNPKPKVIFTIEQRKEVKKIAEEMAKEMVKEVAPKLAKEMIKGALAQKKEESADK